MASSFQNAVWIGLVCGFGECVGPDRWRLWRREICCRYGLFVVVSSLTKSSALSVFLFVLLSDGRFADKVDFSHVLKLKGLTVERRKAFTDTKGVNYPHCFQIKSPQKSFAVAAESEVSTIL